MRVRVAVVVMLIASGLATFQALPVQAANATSTRLSGTNRFETAAAMAEAKFPNGVASVVLASGLTFADALAGVYYAGFGSAACPQSAILLTTPDTLPPATQQALATLHAKRVTILGGTTAITDNVASQLQALGLTVNRIGGINRFETMLDLVTACGAPSQKVAFIASGLNFPDALSAGGASYGKHIPIILTLPDQLSVQAQQALTTLGITSVLIMGGASAISPAVNGAITGMGITIAQQFAGHDRADTAAKFATWAVANLGFSKSSVALARGDDFADALAGAQVTGDPEITLLTLNPTVLAASTIAYLLNNQQFINSLTVLGGTTAITPSNVTTATNAANGQAPPAATWAITAVSPANFLMHGGTHTITLSGTFPQAPFVWLLKSADNPHPATQSCPSSQLINATVSGSTSTSVSASFDIPGAFSDGCPAGHYDIGVGAAADSARVTQATLQDGLILSPAIDGSAANVFFTGKSDHMDVAGNGFSSFDQIFLQPSVDNTNAPASNCGSSTNELPALLEAGGTASRVTIDLTFPSGCPLGRWDVVIDDTAHGGGIGGCADCILLKDSSTTTAVRTMSISPSSPVLGQNMVVTYSGGVDPRTGDQMFATSSAPGSLAYSCSETTELGASGTCTIPLPNDSTLAGKWFLVWNWQGNDGRTNPCASNLTFDPNPPPTCTLTFTASAP